MICVGAAVGLFGLVARNRALQRVGTAFELSGLVLMTSLIITMVVWVNRSRKLSRR